MTRTPAFMLTGSVSVKPYSGESALGPVYGDAVDIDVYAEQGNVVAIDAQGQEVVCNLFLIAAHDAAIAVKSQITYAAQTYEAVDVQNIDNDHLEVYARSRA